MMTKRINQIFNVGDLVHRILRVDDPPTTDIYRIESIREENGGSFHDGYSISTIATLHNISTNTQETEILLRYDVLTSNRVYDYAVHSPTKQMPCA